MSVIDKTRIHESNHLLYLFTVSKNQFNVYKIINLLCFYFSLCTICKIKYLVSENMISFKGETSLQDRNINDLLCQTCLNTSTIDENL